MKRFVAGTDRSQSTLLPECLDDFIDESNPVRVIAAKPKSENYARNGQAASHPACRGPQRPPPARYHTAKTHIHRVARAQRSAVCRSESTVTRRYRLSCRTPRQWVCSELMNRLGDLRLGTDLSDGPDIGWAGSGDMRCSGYPYFSGSPAIRRPAINRFALGPCA